MIKAVFFDIDGTLVSFDTHRVPESTLRSLEELRRRGIRTFISTGRSELQIDNVDLSLFDGVISLNGQMARDADGIFYKSVLPAAEVDFAIDYFTRTGVTGLLEGADFLLANEMNARALATREKARAPFPTPSDLRQASGREVIQVVIFGDRQQERELLAGMPSCDATRWSPELADIFLRGNGKHIGIEKTLARYGLTREESMAFGDGENDISMLRYAGTGIAMGNAPEP